MKMQEDQKKIIGENIKAARRLQGMSQRALAEKIGIAFQNLSVWENGKGAPSAKYLVKLSETLNVSLDNLTTEFGIRKSANEFFSNIIGNNLSGNERPSPFHVISTATDEQGISNIIHQELDSNPSIKLIIMYLEECLRILKQDA